MGMHTGKPLVRHSKYVGLDVHVAARIMSTAHGGQVVLSAATRALLDDGFAVRQLGWYRVKDVGEPLSLYQLGGGEFPRCELWRTQTCRVSQRPSSVGSARWRMCSRCWPATRCGC